MVNMQAREKQMHNYWLSSNTAERDVKNQTEVTNVILIKLSTISESIIMNLCDSRADRNTDVQVTCLELNTDKWDRKTHVGAATTTQIWRNGPQRDVMKTNF